MYTRNGTLVTGGDDAKKHSKRVGMMQKSTRNECGNLAALAFGKRVVEVLENLLNYTRKEWGRCKTTLETSGEDVKLHSKRVEKM